AGSADGPEENRWPRARWRHELTPSWLTHPSKSLAAGARRTMGDAKRPGKGERIARADRQRAVTGGRRRARAAPSRHDRAIGRAARSGDWPLVARCRRV